MLKFCKMRYTADLNAVLEENVTPRKTSYSKTRICRTARGFKYSSIFTNEKARYANLYNYPVIGAAVNLIK